eukprot:3525443-Amphidinium_carterae.1
MKLLTICNTGVSKRLDRTGKLKMKYCTYLEMLRNAASHTQSHEQYRWILDYCLPPRASQLIE